MVRSRAFAAGLPNWQQITAHSLRRTGAQRIAAAGGDPTKQGRWKPGSAVVKKDYLDRAQSRAENPWLLVHAQRRQHATEGYGARRGRVAQVRQRQTSSPGAPGPR